MTDKEARYDEKNTLLSFGWDSGYMQVRLDGLLPTNPHKLNIFAKALNDNIGHTPFGFPSAGSIVLGYIDTAIADALEAVIFHKMMFSTAAVDVGIKMPDYDKLCKHFSSDVKLTDAISGHVKPLKQKLSEVTRKLKASQKKAVSCAESEGPFLVHHRTAIRRFRI